MKNTILFISIFLATFSAVVQAQTHSDTIRKKLESYKKVKLTTDISSFTKEEKEGIKLLINAASQMDELFWMQTFRNRHLIDTIQDSVLRKYAQINYGPWDRLDNNKPFIAGVGAKPAGASFYPVDITKAELDSLPQNERNDPYSIIYRDKLGKINYIPYQHIFRPQLEIASNSLQIAASIFEKSDPEFSNYLNARAYSLLTSDYDTSDRIWLDMKNNRFDIIIGPIENYEDQLLGMRTSFESYVLVKDMAWSKKLEHYISYLPELQSKLPVDKKYKSEKAGSSSQLNAYDVIYYAGDCNAGSKTIAVNLPNSEKLQLEKGTRRSQLKNAIRAKYDNILVPIAGLLIDSSQLKHITFDAFFNTIMFHEVAHGLGIKNTINGKGTVNQALGPLHNALEEGKADILGLYMITQLFDKKAIKEGELMDHYVTFLAGIFRSVRFGAASAHGKANMVRFNFFKEKGAFTRNKNGRYVVNFEKMKQAMTELSTLILTLQGNGDKEGVEKLFAEKGKINDELQKDLDKLATQQIPVDIIFEQGIKTLGLDNE